MKTIIMINIVIIVRLLKSKGQRKVPCWLASNDDVIDAICLSRISIYEILIRTRLKELRQIR
jgi:predicted nucleic acid-binding protein